MNFQQILEQLQGMGITGEYTGWGDLSGITGEQIAGGVGSTYDVEGLEGSMFPGLSNQLLQATKGSTYSPFIEAQSGSLLSDLSTGLGGQKATQAAGGFAGSGGQKSYMQGAKDVFGKGMSDVISQTGQQRSQAFGELQNMITGWKKTGQEFA
jgi:hypothetical protein